MSVSNPQKTLSTAAIHCGGITTVTLSFDAAAELASAPADIVLVMDRSGSMTQDRLSRAKEAADRLIDTVVSASGGSGLIENGSRLGIVSFSDTAVQDVPLTTDPAPLHTAIAGLNRGGLTNHKSAFEVAGAMLDPQSPSRQIIVLFTDGITTVGGAALPVAEQLKASGIEIFCIGLQGNLDLLNAWASDPKSVHVAHTEDTDQIGRIFSEITAEVVKAGALDVTVRETLAPDFKLVRVLTPAVGTVQVTGTHDLIWTVDAAGLSAAPETTSLSFEIMHIGTTGGSLAVNQSVVYEDRDGNTLTFPAPQVEVDCSGAVLYPESCPTPTAFLVEGCRDAALVHLPDARLQSLGRIVQVDATVRNLCPGKRVAVAVLLTETGPNGEEYTRGIKTVTLPPLTGEQCQDVTLRCLRFVVPEDLDPTGTADSICSTRHFHARVMANYVDSDFVCCDAQSVIL